MTGYPSLSFQIVIYILDCLFLGYVSLSFPASINRALPRRRLFTALGYVFLSLAIGIASLLSTGTPTLLLWIGAEALVGYLVYSKNRTQLVYNCIYILCLCCGQIIISFLLQYVFSFFSFDNMLLLMVTNLFTKDICLLLLSKIIITLFQGKTSGNLALFQLLQYAVLPVCSIFFIGTLMTFAEIYVSPTGFWLILFNAVLLIGLNLYVSVLFQSIIKNHELENELSLSRQQADMQFCYYTELERKYQDSRKIVHDIRNHMLALQELYARQSSETEQYVADLHQLLNSLGQTYYCTSQVLNIILNDKAGRARDLGIAFDCRIGEVDLDFLKQFDLTTIFANLLDNAIEAAHTGPQPARISLRMEQVNEFLILNLTNTSREPLASQSGAGWRSKKYNHKGIGMENVRQALSRYEGTLSTHYQDGVVTVSAVIPIPPHSQTAS